MLMSRPSSGWEEEEEEEEKVEPFRVPAIARTRACLHPPTHNRSPELGAEGLLNIHRPIFHLPSPGNVDASSSFTGEFCFFSDKF